MNGPHPTGRRAAGPAGGGRPDAVAWAERLRGRVEDEINAAFDGADLLDEVYVGWVAALDVATCPARYRAGGDDGWGFPGWSPTLAAGAVGRAALAEHLRRTAHAPGDASASPLPDPLEVVRNWLREATRAPVGSVAEWIRDVHRDGDRAAVAATAATAGRWLAGFVRVVGWPLPDRLNVVVDNPEGPHTRRWHRPWRPPAAAKTGRHPVAVASRPDAVLGKVTPAGEFDLLVHRPFSPSDDALVDRAAFEAVAGALTGGIVPRHVVVTTADTGEQARCPVDPALLDRGVALVVEVVRQRALAAEAGWTLDDGTPSAACHHCPVRDDCGPGKGWLAGPGPGRWRNGLPVLSAEDSLPGTG